MQLKDEKNELKNILPKLDLYKNKYILIKVGGSVISDRKFLKNIAKNVYLLNSLGIKTIIVHGGGSEITSLCKKFDIETKFIDGQRVTDKETIDIVQMSLHGKTNRDIVNELNSLGLKSVGFSGQDASLIIASQLKPELEFVGKIEQINTEFIKYLLKENYIPVISSIGCDLDGNSYNINADIAAGEIAGSLSCEKFILISDVNGIYLEIDKPETRIAKIDSRSLSKSFYQKKYSGGMLPKIEGCLRAIQLGTKNSHIIDGKDSYSLLMCLLTDQDVGTLIYREN